MSLSRWAGAVLRRVAPADRVEDLLGDLEEVHRQRVRERGRGMATVLTALEVAETAFTLLTSRGSPAMPSWIDIELGLRLLRKYPVLTAVSVLPMAAAVAAAAGVYAITENIRHPRLPFAEGDRIVGIENWNVATQTSDARLLHDFTTWREDLRSVVELGAFEAYRPNLTLEGGRAEPLRGSRIGASAFRVTGVPPLLGRPLQDADERSGAPDVAVIGYDLWQSAFGGDPGVVGRELRLGGSSPVVVGVMPPEYAFPYDDDFWVPLRYGEAEWEPLRGPQVFVFGRLRAGSDVGDVQAELDLLARRRAAQHPGTYRSIRARVVPYGANLWGGPTLALSGLRALLVLLLLVVCSTVGVLVFVRNLARAHEVSMRFMLGASRRRITTQLLAESLVMASVASLLGLVLMSAGLRWVYATATSAAAGEGGLPFWIRPQLAPGTLGYIGVLTLLSAIVSGLLPALTLTRWREGSRGLRLLSGGSTIRIGTKGTLAIAGQTALTIGLLALVSGRLPGILVRDSGASTIPRSSYLAATYRPGDVPATNDEKDLVLRRVVEALRQSPPSSLFSPG